MRTKKALYNVGTNLILQFVVVLYGFIVPKIIISNYGSNVNGLLSSITQFLAYITLLESGFGPVVKSVLYKPVANKDKKTICQILKTTESFFRKIAYIFLLYLIFLCVLYPILVNGDFNYIYTISLIVIIGISTFAEYFFGMTYKLYLQAEQESYVISIIQIITYIISVIIIILLAKIGVSIQTIKLASGIIFIIRPLCQNFYVKWKYNIHIDKNVEKYELKQKWDGLAQHIAGVIHVNTDITLLTIFTTLSEVSVYSVYYMVVKGIKSIIQAFSNGIDSIFGNMLAKREKDNLNKKFKLYEIIYFTIVTIIFSATMVLITPFIEIYTKDVIDVNYTRKAFGILLVVSEYIWAIRLPYSSLTLAAGHFKETRIGAWIECIINIVISVILVNKFGLIGVTFGTIVAMLIRTIEFVYHTNKFILNRSIWNSIIKILLIILETIMIVTICKFLPLLDNTNYINWIINAIIVASVSSLLTIVINFIFYKKEYLETINLIKGIFIKRKQKSNQQKG